MRTTMTTQQAITLYLAIEALTEKFDHDNILNTPAIAHKPAKVEVVREEGEKI